MFLKCKTMSINRKKMIHIIAMCLLFLAGMNFANKYYYFLLLAAVITILTSRKLKIDSNFIILIMLAWSLLLFSPYTRDKVTSMVKPFLYPLAYCMGLNFFDSKAEQNVNDIERLYIRIIMILSAAPFFHYVLNWFTNINSSLGRNTIDIWTKSIASATLQSAMSCMMIGVAVGVLFSENIIRNKIISFFILIVAMGYNMILGSRTLIVLTLLNIAVSFLYTWVMQKRYNKKSKLLVTMVFVIIIFYLIIKINLFGILEWIEQSNLYDRFVGDHAIGFFEDSRINNKIKYLANFSKSLLGGQNLKTSGFGYAHDIILDTYDEGGILALITIIVFMISSIKLFVKVLNNRMYELKTRQLILGLYVAFYMEFMIEPILQGVPWLFALFCFGHGLLVRLNLTKRRQNRRNGWNKYYKEKTYNCN